MIDFNEIYETFKTKSDRYVGFSIVTLLCLVFPFLYHLYLKRKNSLKVVPKKTIIIQAKDSEDDISSCGGFIPYLRTLHANQGPYVSLPPKFPYPNTFSVVDPVIVKSTLPIGDRPVDLFKFLEPFLGNDNLQIFDAVRAANFRKLVGPSLKNDVISAKYKSTRNIGINLIKRWENLVKNDKDSVIKMQEECLEFSLRATLDAVIGTDESENLDVKSYKMSYDIVLSGVFDKQFGALDTLREEEFNQSINFLKTLSSKLIDRRRKKILETKDDGERTKNKNLFDILVSENDPNTDNPFTDELITSIISGYIMAGYHTTGVAIPYTILALTQNHDVQIKLQEEIDKKLEGRLPTLYDLSKMEYLTQVVKESLRVHPPAPFCARLLKSTLPTTLPTIIKSEELTLQPNATILYPIPLYHENPDFHPQPEIFDPTRFSPERIKNIKPYSYCPFGFGARICPAEKIAMIDIEMMICLIMQKFDVELAMKLEDVKKRERFVVMAENDILIKLVPRAKED